MILSDSQIKARLLKGELIIGGQATRANECSYSFRPGKAFPVVSSDECVDFEADPSATLSIEPGQMVWIRTNEMVSMPGELVGFWWQTNSLSRRGLMLVNMSMVEPIYNGDLACLFVNFGEQIIVIDSQTSIAKMVFMQIEGKIDTPHLNSATRHHYDAKLLQLAINQPPSFLKVGDLAHDLEMQRSSALSGIEDRLNDALEKMRKERAALDAQVRKDLESAKDEIVSEFQTDAPKLVRGSLGLAALGVVLLGAAIAVSGQLKTYVFADERQIAQEEANKAIDSRLSVPADAGNGQIAMIIKRLDEIEAKIDQNSVSGERDE